MWSPSQDGESIRHISTDLPDVNAVYDFTSTHMRAAKLRSSQPTASK